MDPGIDSTMEFVSSSSLLPQTNLRVDLPPHDRSLVPDSQSHTDIPPPIHQSAYQPPLRQLRAANVGQSHSFQEHILPYDAPNSIRERYPESSQRTEIYDGVPTNVEFGQDSNTLAMVSNSSNATRSRRDRFASREITPSSMGDHPSSSMTVSVTHTDPNIEDAAFSSRTYSTSESFFPSAFSQGMGYTRESSHSSAFIHAPAPALQPIRSTKPKSSFSQSHHEARPPDAPSRDLLSAPPLSFQPSISRQNNHVLGLPPRELASHTSSISMCKASVDWTTPYSSHQHSIQSISASHGSSIAVPVASQIRLTSLPRTTLTKRGSTTPPEQYSDSGSPCLVSTQSIPLCQDTPATPPLLTQLPLEGPDVHPPAKKKKKAKMHTCEICDKRFPRPSGLRTHMNTHNNARPYPCGFPGCLRTFGVRSNAKRHLRTHGVIPPASSATDSETPYVVGFSIPVVLPSSNSLACAEDDEGVACGDQQEPRHQMAKAPFFKLRWMPPSLTSRTNAAVLKSVSENGDISDDDDDDDESEFGFANPSVATSADSVSSLSGSRSLGSVTEVGILDMGPGPPLSCVCEFPCSDTYCQSLPSAQGLASAGIGGLSGALMHRSPYAGSLRGKGGPPDDGGMYKEGLSPYHASQVHDLSTST